MAGVCPLPFENARTTCGPGMRTWQFAWSLARAGHEVRLLAMMAPGAYEDEGSARLEERQRIRIERFSDVAFLDPTTIRRAIRQFQPHALVGASLYGSSALARAGEGLPLWVDQFGHVMAEAQAKAAVERRNWPLAHAWGLLEPALRAADRLSVVSERQRYAVIGELGALGRLTAETCGYEFISVIPCALVPEGETAAPAGPSPEPAIKGRLAPADAFVALWSGSFNVWSDVETAVRGLEEAMSRQPRIHFVATGGAVPGLDTEAYERLQRLVARSPHAPRFHLEGWVRAERVAGYVAEADIGVLAEKPIYEGMLGSKNRIVQWMGGGLPVVYNRVGDLGDLLEERGLGLTFPVGDAAALGERLVWAADNGGSLREMAARARGHASRDLTFEATTRELVAWAGAPAVAPDGATRRAVRTAGDHATLRQRMAARARRVPMLRGSEGLVRLWRRLLGRQG